MINSGTFCTFHESGDQSGLSLAADLTPIDIEEFIAQAEEATEFEPRVVRSSSYPDIPWGLSWLFQG